MQMRAVDFGNNQRDLSMHAKGAGVGDYGVAGAGEARLELGGDGGVQRGEDYFGRARRISRGNAHACNRRWNGRLKAPARRFVIRLAERAAGGGDPGELEPGVDRKSVV